MLSKILQHVETVGQNTLIRKTFQRGLQSIDTVSAYSDNKLYFRSWRINEHKHRRHLFQSYSEGKPIPSSKGILDYYA